MDVKGFFEENRWLSNFWLCPVPYNGVTYPSSENAFQAAKVDTQIIPELKEWYQQQFLKATPGQAKRLGLKVPMRKDWETAKFQVMEEVLRSKFTNNPELKEKLLSTGMGYLEETNNWHDTTWGVCNGVGENNLGKLLMKIREELRPKLEIS
jgi:ribA/ribD-fused uncharacterized protein